MKPKSQKNRHRGVSPDSISAVHSLIICQSAGAESVFLTVRLNFEEQLVVAVEHISRYVAERRC